MSRRAQNSQKVQCIALGFDQKTSKVTLEIFELSLSTFWHMDIAADMTNATIPVLSSLLVVKPSKCTLLFMVFLFIWETAAVYHCTCHFGILVVDFAFAKCAFVKNSLLLSYATVFKGQAMNVPAAK